jgi:hypothetical protein
VPAHPDMTLLRAGLAVRAGDIALDLLGEPNRAMSTKRELRFGRHGSLSVVVAGPKAGMWHDHQIGAGGDMLALIMREHRGSFLDAVRFAEQFIGQAPREAVPASRAPVTTGDNADAERNRRSAMDMWEEAVPIVGTLAAHYLAGAACAICRRRLTGMCCDFIRAALIATRVIPACYRFYATSRPTRLGRSSAPPCPPMAARSVA